MTNFRKMLLSTAAIGLTTVATVSSTSAADVEKKFAWSGHVNRAIIMGSDGEENFIAHEDGNVSGSRARMKASAKSSSLEIGALVELAIQAGAGASQNAAGSDSFSIRHSMLYFENSMGTVKFGDTSHAGGDFVAVDMSGTSHADDISGTLFDSVKFNDSSSVDGSQAAGVTVATAHDSDMSLGRQSGIGYISPDFNGFGFAVSHVTAGSGGYQITYGGDFNGMEVEAGYSYANIAGATDESYQGGGVGVTLPSGLNISANYRTTALESAANTANNADPELYYGKVGYTLSGISDLGNTNVAVAYKNTEDASATGDDLKMVSFLVNQALSDYGTTIYGGYSNISYDTAASDFDDINGFFIGSRIVF